MLRVLLALLLAASAASAQSISIRPNAAVKIHPGYMAGKYYAPPVTPSGAPTAIIANRARCSILNIFETITVSELQITIVTLAASGLAQAALYSNINSSGQPRPNLPLASTGNIDTSTTGDKSGAVTPVQLSPGPIWYCTNWNNATNVATSISPAVGLAQNFIGADAIGDSVSASSATVGISAAVTFGTWSDLSGATWADVQGANLPIVGFLVASVP